MGKKKFKKEKITNEAILSKIKYNFSRDSEWFKRTTKKIEEVKEELNKNFYDETKKKQKIDFIHKLRDKLKDYKDAIKFEERYKKVRFVERRKLERKLVQINKEIEKEKDNEEKLKELNEKKEKIVDDINYIKFYPKTYKYYSLFPNKDADNEEMIKKREKMKQKIKFYLNGKKNKERGVKEEDDGVDSEIEEDIEGDENKNEEGENEEEKSEEERNKKEEEGKNKKKEEKKKKKDEKNNNKEKKEKKVENYDNNYENAKKKKVFKDSFFELDE